MSSESGSNALDAANGIFHEAYGGARESLRHQIPVLVVLQGELALHQQNQRRVLPYSRPVFARAKSVAHIAVALFTLTDTESSRESQRTGVARLLDHITASLDETERSDPQPIEDAIKVLLERCLQYAQVAREHAPSRSLRRAFASDAGPRILHITELATREQIAGLHGAVEAAFRSLSPRERGELEVVVVGDHQARARSLGMQYFKRRLGEEPGVDERVTYGENIEDESEAVQLVATRRLDKQIAQAFFGDEHRLQRDVLGDAAKRCLDEMSFPP
jgi:hypothetical protein